MQLYAVTHHDPNADYWTDLYMADDHDHADDQCRNENPGNITIVSNIRIPFYLIERAYYSEKARHNH